MFSFSSIRKSAFNATVSAAMQATNSIKYANPACLSKKRTEIMRKAIPIIKEYIDAEEIKQIINLLTEKKRSKENPFQELITPESYLFVPELTRGAVKALAIAFIIIQKYECFVDGRFAENNFLIWCNEKCPKTRFTRVDTEAIKFIRNNSEYYDGICKIDKNTILIGDPNSSDDGEKAYAQITMNIYEK